MPTTYAHYRFGRDVLEALPRRAAQAAKMNRELFDIGLHGPDILFYYKALTPNRISGQGFKMHDKNAAQFFLHGKEVIDRMEDKAAARAYLYGFICHFTLDSECHPYVEKMIQTSGISHSEIEMEFDRYLLTEDGISPTGYLATGHIHPTMEHARVIAPFFEDLTAEDVKKALSSMIVCHKALMAPNRVKRSLLYGGMKLVHQYDSLHGMVMSETANPDCSAYCLLLKKLYEAAVPAAADLIIKYQKVLLQGEPLPERFQRTFGAGEHWEELIL